MRLHLWACVALLTACGSESGQQQGEPKQLPIASGPPVAQEKPAAPEATAKGPRWENIVSPNGMALRLTDPNGRLLLSLTCAKQPRRLIVNAPGFTPVGSEDRFALGLGEEPVTLVADLEGQGPPPGVTAKGPVPPNLSDLLEGAKQVSGLYGNQRIGPHPPPPPALAEAFDKSCSGSDQ